MNFYSISTCNLYHITGPLPDHWLCDIHLITGILASTGSPACRLITSFHLIAGHLPSQALNLTTGPLPDTLGLPIIIGPLPDDWPFTTTGPPPGQWFSNCNPYQINGLLPDHWSYDHWASPYRNQWPSTWWLALYHTSSPLDHWPCTITGSPPEHWPSTVSMALSDHRHSTWSLGLHLNTGPLPNHWLSTASGPLHNEKPSLYLITGCCDELLPGLVGGLPLLEWCDKGGAIGQAGGNSEGRVQAPADKQPCSGSKIFIL